MRKKTPNAIPGELAPIAVPPDFPVDRAVFNTRGENPAIGAHIHNLFEIGYCYSGSGVFLIGGKIFTFKPGDAVVITSHEVHLAKGDPGGVTSWGFLNFDPAGLLAQYPEALDASLALDRCFGDDFPNLVDGEQFPELAACIRAICEERRDDRPDSHAMIRALVWRLALLLRRYYSGPGAAPDEDRYEDIRRIAPALERMNAHFDRPPTLAELAAKSRMSVPNFRKLFRRAMGCSPQPYLAKMRLTAASSMLKNTGLPIGEIALRCGFRTLSNFNRQFLAAFGTSPNKFRRSGKIPTARSRHSRTDARQA